MIGGEKGRSATLERQLRSLGIDFHNFPGVFYQTFPSYFSEKRSQVLSRTKLTLAELGCARAHQNVYEDILKRGYSYAVVFEDDAVIVDIAAFQDFVAISKSEIEVVKPLVRSFFSRSAILAKYLPSKLETHQLFQLKTPPSTTTCYLINNRACQILREVNKFGDWTADWPQSELVEYQIVLPMIVKPDETQGSLIGNERFAQRLKGPYRAKVLIFEFLFLNFFLAGYNILSFREYLNLVYKPRIIWWISYLKSKQLPGQDTGLRSMKSARRSYLERHVSKSNLI